MSISDSFFKKCGKSAQDIEKIADEVMNMDEEGKKSFISDLGHKLNRSLGMASAKEENHSAERSLLNEELKSFHPTYMLWGMNPKFTRGELVDWLKKYYSYIAYIEEFGLETEAMRNNFRSAPNKPKH